MPEDSPSLKLTCLAVSASSVLLVSPFVDGPVCQGSAPALALAQLQKPRDLQGQREEAPGLEREVSWVMASGILTFFVPLVLGLAVA